MSRPLITPIIAAVLGGTVCGVFWLAIMIACGIPAALAAKAAAIGTTFAIYCWISFSIEKDTE